MYLFVLLIDCVFDWHRVKRSVCEQKKTFNQPDHAYPLLFSRTLTSGLSMTNDFVIWIVREEADIITLWIMRNKVSI